MDRAIILAQRSRNWDECMNEDEWHDALISIATALDNAELISEDYHEMASELFRIARGMERKWIKTPNEEKAEE